MKLLPWIFGTLALLVSSTAFADDLQEAIKEAIKKALAGQEVYPFVLNGHGFHIKPITVVKNGDRIGATGQLSHDIKGPDEQIYYKIKLIPGQPDDVQINISGQWLPDKMSTWVHGSWKEAAHQIVDTVALMIALTVRAEHVAQLGY